LDNETDGLPPYREAVTSAEPIAPAQAPASHKIFFGKDGLRAGWSLLIFIALFAGLIYGANVVGHKLYPPAPKTANASSEISPLRGFIAEAVPFVVALLVTWTMSKIERRPNSVTLWKTGLLVIDSRLLFGGNILRYGGIWLVGFLLVGLLEEYLTRGYVQYTLARGLAGFYEWAFKARHSKALGFWTSAIILSTLFGLGHNSNPGESPIGLLSAGLASMIFCFSLWRTGSLWWAIGFHTSWDWAQSFLYGVADSGTMVQHHLLATHPVGKAILSGGTTGPEGSILIVAVIGLVSLIIFFTLPRTQYGEAAK
jgi:membrane protease YdiL (CAAX protease family)